MIMTDLPPVGVEKFLEQESAQGLDHAEAIRLGQIGPKTVHARNDVACVCLTSVLLCLTVTMI